MKKIYITTVLGRMGWIILLLLISASIAHGLNYEIDGTQNSKIEYELSFKVKPSPNIRKLILDYVEPQNFSSPTYSQKLEQLDFTFTPPPEQKKKTIDENGNHIIKLTWISPPKSINTKVNLIALNQVSLKPVQTKATFPIQELPEDVKKYLKASKQVESHNEAILAKAKALTQKATSQFDAVQKILAWIIDHMNYVLTPASYNASYSFRTGKGNCQNYSHLAAALMRAVHIPVRIVNGVTLKYPYDIQLKNATYTTKMAQGRHSWIEVYFPDLGWMPVDPSSTELYVSNRFIRIEVGLDNNETKYDGLVQWTQVKGSNGEPELIESIDAKLVYDKIHITGIKTNYGPQKTLLCPKVSAIFDRIPILPPEKDITQLSPSDLLKFRYIIPFEFGNLEFPKNIDFLDARGPAQKGETNVMELRKNFLVETAEYVTTQGQQYAQTFIIEKPIKLETVDLALHKFGGDGQLWIEVFEDKNGKPFKYITTSELIDLNLIKYSPGYHWVPFYFNQKQLLLAPGRYWIALGFTGSPVINWFYSYGKPVGPHDGTRYKTIFDTKWSRSLAFEFNYRIKGFSGAKR